MIFCHPKSAKQKEHSSANLRQSLTASTRTLRKGIACRTYPKVMAMRTCSPGRCRTRSSRCFQAASHPLEKGLADALSASSCCSKVLICSINQLFEIRKCQRSDVALLDDTDSVFDCTWLPFRRLVQPPNGRILNPAQPSLWSP